MPPGGPTVSGDGKSSDGKTATKPVLYDIPRDPQLEKVIFGDQKSGINFDKYDNIKGMSRVAMWIRDPCLVPRSCDDLCPPFIHSVLFRPCSGSKR